MSLTNQNNMGSLGPVYAAGWCKSVVSSARRALQEQPALLGLDGSTDQGRVAIEATRTDIDRVESYWAKQGTNASGSGLDQLGAAIQANNAVGDYADYMLLPLERAVAESVFRLAFP